jgi:hypothetical protein
VRLEISQSKVNCGALYYTWQGNIHAQQQDRRSTFSCGALTEAAGWRLRRCDASATSSGG